MKLLPIASTPFAVPTDRDMLPSERREFVRTHRSCIFGYSRRDDGPAMSAVYYIPTDTDELLISTMGGRAKAKAVARNGKVSLCVVDENWPIAYVQVYCDAHVEEDPKLIVDVMMAVGGRMSGTPMGEDIRPIVEEMAASEGRVLIRCRPYATFAQPPSKVSQDDKEKGTRRITASMPWDATDET